MRFHRLFALLFVAGCATSGQNAPAIAAAAPSAVEVSDRQVQQYKMGIEFGCRDQGSAKGDSRAKVDAVCKCAVDTLDQSVSEEEWRQAAYYGFNRDQRGEAQIMMPHFKAQAAKCQNIAESRSEKTLPSIVGTWEWTRPTNGCKEVYSYKGDGTLQVSSGNEITENTYSLSETPDSVSRYAVTTTTTRDNGGKDCADKTANDVGKSSTTFVFVNYAGTVMMDCYSVKGGDCFGPLFRVSE